MGMRCNGRDASCMCVREDEGGRDASGEVAERAAEMIAERVAHDSFGARVAAHPCARSVGAGTAGRRGLFAYGAVVVAEGSGAVVVARAVGI